MKLVAGFITAILLLVGGVAALIYSGAYNVAASEDDTALEKWILRATMTNSVKAHAGATAPPQGFDAEDHVHAGFHLFDEMCVQCHGAPGKERGEVGLGLRPEPPALSDAVRRWNTAQLFWIVKHGIKATGMPAFGKTHSETQLWNLVAFVQKLPDLSPERYGELGAGGHGHEHTH